MFKRVVTFDVETTTKHKGHPFTPTNKLVTIQLKVDNEEATVYWKEDFNEALDILNSASCVVATNAKFDLHWLRRELGFTAKCVWDLQIGEFILSSQLWVYPDLDGMCINYSIPQKIDIVKQLWKNGVDTDQIDKEILEEYGKHDAEITYQVFLKQLELFQTTKKHQYKLFRLHCNDLIVLQEMEYNGILYDKEGSLEKATELNKQIGVIDANLNQFSNGIPLNFNSRDDVSTLLYGGIISVDTKVPIGEFKSGARIGQTKYKTIVQEYRLPRRVAPLKNSELAKEGYFSTDYDTLISLKPDKETKYIITKLLERVKIKKLQSTYLTGFPKRIEEMEWENDILHSNLNQCAVVTGRLSSTKPNTQNLPKESKRFCITRY